MVFYRSLFVCVAFICVFSSCKDPAPYQGFSQIGVLHYKLLSFESEKKKELKEGEILDIHFTITTMQDSLLYNSKFQHFSGSHYLFYSKDSLPSSVFNLFQKINLGDSVKVIAPSMMVNQALFDRNSGIVGFDTVIVNLKWKDSYDSEEYAYQLMKLSQLKEDMDMEEQRNLRQYIRENEIKARPISLGYYYMPVEEGQGSYVEAGKYVELHYKGYFLDGLIFDSTRTDWPFDLVIGDQDQLIKGLEDGITLMKEGGKAKFIIPSQLAFGDKGSSTGIVPPYTTVMYEVEIVKVN